MLVLAWIHSLARKPEKGIATEIIKCKGRRHECTKTLMLYFFVSGVIIPQLKSHPTLFDSHN